VQAVRDRAVHIGLLSRPLSSEERAGPAATLALHPYAWSVVVFAAHPAVVDRSISAAALVELLRGEPSSWSDGSPRVFLSRERGDSSHRAAVARVAGFREAEREAQEATRFRVLYSDVELRFSLLATIGSVGLTDLGASAIDQLPLVVLALDGIAPTRENALAGRYPLVKPFVALVPERAHPFAESFLRFVRSEAGRSIIEESGFLTVEPRGGVP
jgi:phosphate transport system substrate-binding protein